MLNSWTITVLKKRKTGKIWGKKHYLTHRDAAFYLKILIFDELFIQKAISI